MRISDWSSDVCSSDLQAYQPQSSEGMVRCYVCGHRVVGFGHNLITALMTPTAIDTTSSTPQPMGRAMFGPEVTRFVALWKAMEDRWMPEMQRLHSIADHDLWLLWAHAYLFTFVVRNISRSRPRAWSAATCAGTEGLAFGTT